MRDAQRIDRGARGLGGEFAGGDLAQQHGAAVPRNGNAARINRRTMAAIDSRTVFGGIVDGVEDVLDRERHSAQGGGWGGLGKRGGGKRLCRIAGRERPHLRVAFGDAVQTCAHDSRGGGFAALDGIVDLPGTEMVQRFHIKSRVSDAPVPGCLTDRTLWIAY
ncbi:hypothetical protein D3C72_1742950 [compost metagenome]